MLSQLERKLTSVIADGLSLRSHLSVLEAPGPPPSLAPGKGAVLVSLAELTSPPTFQPGQFSVTEMQSRRVLPIGFDARIEFFLRPADPGAAGLAAARETLLDDLSITSHHLAQDSFASGRAFTVAAADPGFAVHSLRFEKGGAVRDADQGNLAGALTYHGSADVWPPGQAQQEGQILAVDTVLVTLPLEIDVQDAVVRSGQTASVRVRSLGGNRLAKRDPRDTQPLSIAATVMSDVPPAQRGTIAGGVEGVETGVRILELTPPQTTIAYLCPGGISRTRIEYVALHLATPERRRGAFLGSTAIRLEPS